MCIWNPNPTLEEVTKSNIDELNKLTDALILENIRLKEELIFPQVSTEDLENRILH